jgi:hypothetical protein
MGKIDEKDRDFLNLLVKGLKDTGGRSATAGGISFDSDLSAKLKEAYDTIGKLENRNRLLFSHLEALKQTFEFFEVFND